MALNVTVTNAHGSGFITAYRDGSAVPITSNLNYVKGQTVPNLVVVPVGTDGYVDLLNGGSGAGPVDLIADVTGYFTHTSAAGYQPIPPERVVDTRSGIGAPGPLAANSFFPLQLGLQKWYSPQVTAVSMNVTVTNTKGSGFLTLYPAGEATPTASNVNYSAGQTVANSAIVPVGKNGEINVFNGGASAKSTDVIIDITGYYATFEDSSDHFAAYIALPTPKRIVDTRNGTGVAEAQIANGGYDYVQVKPAFVYSMTAYVLNATVTNTKGDGFLAIAPDPNQAYQYQNGTALRPVPPVSSVLNWVPGETVSNLAQAPGPDAGLMDFWNLGGSGGGTDLIVDEFGYYQND